MYLQEEADDDRNLDHDSAIADLGSYTSVQELED